MICSKCGEKYEDDMPRCLWCDAPNPDYAATMERLETEKKTECARLQELREKNKEILHENLAELKKNSVTAFFEIKNALVEESKKNEKSLIFLTKDFKEMSMETMPKKRITLALVLKEIPKILVYVLFILPNVVFLNIWLANIFLIIFPSSPMLIFFGAALLSIALWLTIVLLFVKKRCGLYLRILVWVSEFMVGFTAFEIVRKISSLG
jgi:hypothetical protein